MIKNIYIYVEIKIEISLGINAKITHVWVPSSKGLPLHYRFEGKTLNRNYKQNSFFPVIYCVSEYSHCLNSYIFLSLYFIQPILYFAYPRLLT